MQDFKSGMSTSSITSAQGFRFVVVIEQWCNASGASACLMAYLLFWGDVAVDQELGRLAQIWPPDHAGC